MRKLAALLGSLLFLAIAPGTIAGLLPWWITGWRAAPDIPLAVRAAGALLLAGGGLVLLESFARFALHGEGTPAPVAPTRRLVVTGLYRFVRNPMYLAVLALITGQALWLGRWELLAYGSIVAAGFHLFVLGYEEPTLRGRYGAEYDAFTRAVPRWRPRLRPWRPSA